VAAATVTATEWTEETMRRENPTRYQREWQETTTEITSTNIKNFPGGPVGPT
jgi:hypothetical protein